MGDEDSVLACGCGQDVWVLQPGQVGCGCGSDVDLRIPADDSADEDLVEVSVRLKADRH
jgi:hypothetical protein